MTITELGALGELLGALGVIATLVYLAVQVRQNTRSLEASQRLALAQTYQMRSDALQGMLVQAASSQIGGIIFKATQAGYPENLAALDALSPEERSRFRQWHIAQQAHWDNMHFQYQQGFLDEEYYRDEFMKRVQRLWPTWQALRLTSGRQSFFDELRRLETAQDIGP
ncbi:MAG: hypothetical protein OEW35_18905 [Gammaproteobacteria bacterium]|nr:hypothetical protein [Gammaproteobacteria bacterium]MDH5311367.1 hypothetical protein [Gammaproteobacteria bacterium]